MFEKILTKKVKNNYFYFLLLFFIILGVSLRLYVFLQQYSFEGDERALAVNIILQKNIYELICAPLHMFNQAAPLCFMIISKFISNILGTNEFSLRIFPLLAGIISNFLFYFFAKDYLKPKSLLFSVFLFSVSGPLVSYSAFFKPYSGDVMAALIVLIIAKFSFTKEEINVLMPSLVGVVLIWFSYPVTFILASVALYYGFIFFIKNQKNNLLGLLVISFRWLASFTAASFFAYSNYIISKNYFLEYWKNYFFPVLPNWNSLLKALSELCNITFYCVNSSKWMCLFIVTGAALCILQKKWKYLLLFLPIIITLIASGIKAYPFGDRLILFLSPFVIIFVAKNLAYLTYVDKFIKSKLIKNFSILLMSSILLLQIPFNTKNYFHLRTNTKINDFLSFMDKNMEKNDFIYLIPYDRMYIRYHYYYKNHKLPKNLYYGDNRSILPDSDYFKKEVTDLKKEKSRIWFPFFYMYNYDDKLLKDKIKFFKKYLDSQKDLKLIKYMKDEKKGGEIYLYEYDLKKKLITQRR